MSADAKIVDASAILASLGFPEEQTNERSALALLALTDMKPNDNWSDASAPLLGIAAIMEFAGAVYGRPYKTGSRETFRKYTLHQFRDAGLVVYNPDDPKRAVNSPNTCYQVDASALELLRTYGTLGWSRALLRYNAKRKSLAAKYAQHREMNQTPLSLPGGQALKLSAGPHSDLVTSIIGEFAPRFAPGADILYVGDTADKWAHIDQEGLTALGLDIDPHGKMPDVILYCGERDWLLLIEAVTSVGPVSSKRHAELSTLFAGASCGLVYVTAFPDRSTFGKHLAEIAWETEVWVADQPSHLIHFDGARFLGPYRP